MYTFEFNEQEMSLIVNSLAQKPYGEVFQFVNRLQTEIQKNGENDKSTITLNFSEGELNTVINAVAMRPYVEVFQFINKIQESVVQQNSEKVEITNSDSEES